MSLLLNRHHDSDREVEPQPDPAALEAARQEAERQRINAEATNLLQDSNNLMASLNPAGTTTTAAPNAASTLNSLLDDNGQPSSAANSAINSLLRGGTVPTPATQDQNATPDPNATIASLLGSPMNAGAPGSPSSVFPAPPMPANLAPPDPQMNSALQDSTDEPDPAEVSSLGQMFQSARQQLKDGLSDLVTSAKTLASNIANDPVVQWAASDQGSLTTVPLPQAGDTPEMAENKVFAQSVFGFGEFTRALANGEPVDFAKGIVAVTPVGAAKAVYNYGSKMVNQIGADLGLAGDTILETGPGFSDSQGNQ